MYPVWFVADLGKNISRELAEIEAEPEVEIRTTQDIEVKSSITENQDDDIDGRRAKLKRQDTSTYVAKKTAVQGLMDVALLSANANQLRYIMEYGPDNYSYIIILVLIIASLILQVLVGMSLIFKGRYYYMGKRKEAQKINDYVLVAMFLISTINIFVATFTQIGPGRPSDPTGIKSKAIANSTTGNYA